MDIHEEEPGWITPPSVRASNVALTTNVVEDYRDARTVFFATAELHTQTIDDEKWKPSQVIFTGLFLFSGMAWLVGICGLAALNTDHSTFCFNVTVVGPEPTERYSCIPGSGSLGMLFLGYFFQLITLIGLRVALTYNARHAYRQLILTMLNVIVQIFLPSVDLLLSLESFPSLSRKARVAATGTALLLAVNYILIILLAPMDTTYIGRLLNSETWPPLPRFKNHFARFKKKKRHADKEYNLLDH
eukprot:Ihof_evm3s604 gene=Ihof_evmTU3s604